MISKLVSVRLFKIIKNIFYMKSSWLSVISISLIIIILGWCFHDIQKDEYPSRWEWPKNLHVSIDSLLQCDKNDNIEERNICYRNVFENELPICDTFKRQSIQPILIEDKVKNCTTENKKGFTRWGLWWACFPIYRLYQWRLVRYDECWWTMFWWHQSNNEEIVCKVPIKWEWKTNYSFASITNNDFNEKEWIIKWLESWIIDHINDEYSFVDINCWTGTHCETMYDTLWWSDGKNYFAKWEISDYYWYTGSYYIINWKTYNPWNWSISNKWNNNESPWIFWWVKSNKIIVHKTEDIKHTNPYIPKDTNDFYEWRYNSYRLKTCEIDL